MRAAEIGLDRLLVEVDDRGDDMAWTLAPQLHDIFAEIGLNHLDLRGLEMGVESDLLRHHRLAFGDKLGARLLAERENNGAGVGCGRRVVHRSAALGHLALIGIEIEIEMGERVVLDGAGFLAERVELGQLRSRRFALDDEAALDVLERLLQRSVGERMGGVGLEVLPSVFHRLALPQRPCRGAAMAGSSVMPASTSATWRTSTSARSRASLPAICIRQPRSPASTVEAPVPTMSRTLASRMAVEMSGYLTAKVPPKPQQTSLSLSSTSDSPSTLASSRRGASRTWSSRKDEQES